MILIEIDDRLVALNGEANAGAVWAQDAKEWRTIAATFAGRAWADGEELTPAEAAKRFPAADLGAIPEFQAG